MIDHETGYHQTVAKRFKKPATEPFAARIQALPANLQPVAQALVQRFVIVKTEMPERLWQLSSSELEKIFEFSSASGRRPPWKRGKRSRVGRI